MDKCTWKNKKLVFAVDCVREELTPQCRGTAGECNDAHFLHYKKSCGLQFETRVIHLYCARDQKEKRSIETYMCVETYINVPTLN